MLEEYICSTILFPRKKVAYFFFLINGKELPILDIKTTVTSHKQVVNWLETEWPISLQ